VRLDFGETEYEMVNNLTTVVGETDPDLAESFSWFMRKLAASSDLCEQLAPDVSAYKERLFQIKRERLYSTDLHECIAGIRDIDPVTSINFLRCMEVLGCPESGLVISKQDWVNAAVVSLGFENMGTLDNVWKYSECGDSNGYSLVSIMVTVYLAALSAYSRYIERGKQKDISRDPIVKELEKAKVEIVKLKKKVSSLNEGKKKFESSQRSAIAAAVGPLEKENTELRQQVLDLQEERSQLLAQLDWLENQMQMQEDMSDDSTDLLELPEDNVLFIGGSVNLVKKLKVQHPSWIFIDSTVYNSYPQCGVIFVCAQALAHKTFYRLTKEYGRNLVYCGGTNIERLTESMQRGYTAFVKRQGEL